MKMAKVPLSDHSTVHQAPRIAARKVDDRAIVIVIDSNQLHTLNPTGTALWERCDGRTVAELTAWLQDCYQLSPEQARQDVVAFVQQLRDVGAVVLESEGD